jgi:chemotaxis protein methyltransferase CheR
MIDHSENALGIVAGLLEARTGQKLTKDRLWRVGTALAGVLRQNGFDSLEQLAVQLGRPGQAALAQQVVEALLNNETYFFRDRAMFDQLSTTVLPALARKRERTRRLTIWSVGCSTGQEGYSLAMLFAEQQMRWRDWTIDIIGTDVARSVVAAAREGNYSQFQIQRGLGVAQMVSFFEETRTGWRANEGLRKMVRFEAHNLLEPAPDPGRFDLILCRNVLLYFDRPTRERAFARLASALAPDGMLMLGAGETTVGQTEALVPEKGNTGFHHLALGVPLSPLVAARGVSRLGMAGSR